MALGEGSKTWPCAPNTKQGMGWARAIKRYSSSLQLKCHWQSEKQYILVSLELTEVLLRQ